MRRMVRNLETVEACNRVINKKKRKNEKLAGEINSNIDIINECQMRRGQIKHNKKFQGEFIDGFDLKESYIAKGVDANE